MNDESHLESGLGTALRAYAESTSTDLDALVTRSRLAGTRIRRRRRVGVTLGTATAVAGVVGLASVGGILSGGTTAKQQGFAAQPDTAALAAGQRIDLGHGLVGTVHACKKEPASLGACVVPHVAAPAVSFNRKGIGTGYALVVTGRAPKGALAQAAVFDRIQRRLPGIAIVMPQAHQMAGTSAPPAIYQGQDVTIHLAGWKQVGPVADDKETLEGPGGAVADIVWRDGSEHDAWAASSDKGNAPGVWTSAVHDGVFVSIQGGLGTTDADIQALGASLTWN
ncbi:hypothetical protein GCM10028801_34440 [Nocardioides maradonensis]